MSRIQYVIFVILIFSLIYEWWFGQNYEGPNGHYIKACHSGLIRGVIMGCIMGDFGLSSAVHHGLIHGFLNPAMVHMGY